MSITFAEAYEAWRGAQAQMDRLDNETGTGARWSGFVRCRTGCRLGVDPHTGGQHTEIRQRAEVLVAECKRGWLVALALALMADLEAATNERVR